MSDKFIRDIVLPIFSGGWNSNQFAYEAVAGTAFLIGKNGFAITAAHVVDQIELASAAVGTVKDGIWVPEKILNAEKHPSEDIALIQLQNSLGSSWLVIGNQSEHQTCEYHAWGYPISVAELGEKYNGNRLQTPDLIFSGGHVRRRISGSLPMSIYRGNSFYELSNIAGDGCSGGPVLSKQDIGKPLWNVMGVYIGAGDFGASVGYAVRSDVIHNWVPSILKKSIREESLNV